MKKIILLFVVSILLGSITGCMSYVRIPEVNVQETETKTETETTLKELGNGSIDRARLEKDKTSIEELQKVTNMLICFHDYLELKASGEAVASTEDGEILVAMLFDTSTDVGKAAMRELDAFVGEEDYTIKFSSDFKSECTLEVVKLDTSMQEVVIQFVAESYGIAFYADGDGIHEGVYK